MAKELPIFTSHAYERMGRRAVNVEDVLAVIETGEEIESYPSDTPYPSRLLLGRSGDRMLHAVVAKVPKTGQNVVISVYVPDPRKWEPGFRKRRPRG